MYVKSLVTEILSQSDKKSSHFDERVKDKVLTLDNPVPLEKKDQWKKKRKRSILSMKEKKQMGLFEGPKKCKYQDLLPLHELWKGYMNELIQGQELPRLLKADYHGCFIKGEFSLIHDGLVIQSKCPSFVHLSGIILVEREATFTIVTVQDELKGEWIQYLFKSDSKEK